MVPAMAPWEEALVAGVAARLAAAGLDLVQPLNASWYDAAVAPEYRLPAPGGRSDRLALVVASSRAFWEPFAARLRAEPGRLDRPDPIDDHVAEVVHAALTGLPVEHAVRFSFDPPPRRVAMQRLAHVSGLAPLTAAMLCVHPVYGPWIALRAAIVLDLPGPPGAAPPPAPPACACRELCEPALARAQAATAATAAGDPVAPRWELWLAVRDACPVGREHRYPEALIRYVYTKDREALRAAMLHTDDEPDR